MKALGGNFKFINISCESHIDNFVKIKDEEISENEFNNYNGNANNGNNLFNNRNSKQYYNNGPSNIKNKSNNNILIKKDKKKKTNEWVCLDYVTLEEIESKPVEPEIVDEVKADE